MLQSIKPGVKLEGLQPQMVLAHSVVASCFAAWGLPCVITSGSDSQHMDTSLHYKGKALDYRIRYEELNGREMAFALFVRGALGTEFDVVVEGLNTPNEHLHVEWDPK